MTTGWKSSEDAVRDLSLIDCFGGMNANDLKADLTEEATRHREKTPNRFIDPRTGEEIEIRSECGLPASDGRSSTVTVGRGKLIEEFKHSNKVKRLQEQLRMNRPLGFGNAMIESYFANRRETEEPLPTTTSSPRKQCTERKPTGKRRNLLISSLLENMASDVGEVSGGSGDVVLGKKTGTKLSR